MNYEEEFYEKCIDGQALHENSNLNEKERDSFSNVFNRSFNYESTTNDQFLENFMRIDYQFDFHYRDGSHFQETKTPNKNNESVSTKTSLNANPNHISQEVNMSHNTDSCNTDKKKNIESNQTLIASKKGRPMHDFNLIIDHSNKKIYNPNEDLIEYKNARKRMQNRESAVRSRQKKKETNNQIEEELDYLKRENYRLYYENKNLNQEKNFLIDQIKFMQNLIKSNNMMINSDGNDDMEKNISIATKQEILTNNNQSQEPLSGESSQGNILLPGSKQKKVGIIFNLCIICVLSLLYVNNDYDSTDRDKTITFGSGSVISLNSVKEPDEKSSTLWKRIWPKSLIVLIMMSIAWLVWPCIKYVKDYITARKQKSK